MSDETFETWSGIKLKPIYRPEDLAGFDYKGNLGDAGEYPFTRGKYANMYRQEKWIARELCGMETPRKTNERLKFLASHGQMGLGIVPDTPSQLGLDSDHPMAVASVGTQGVPLCCWQDMQELLDGIALEATTSSFSVPGVMAAPLVAQYIVASEKRGYNRKILRGSVQNDPLQAHVTSCYDLGNRLDLALKLCIDLIEFCAREMPNWHSCTVNAYDLRETGINAVQEMAFTLAIAFAYIQEMLKRGVPVDDFARRMLVIAGVHIDFFEEIAKFRAARRIWARVLKDRFHAQNPRTLALTISMHTAGSSLTTQQPFNNIVRGAYEAMVAVLSGCRGLDISSYDEGVCVPSEAAGLVSMRTQQVLAYETGVTSVVDPLGGSYYVEWLTGALEQEMLQLMQRIEEMGGMAAAVESGWVQQQIEAASLKLREKIDRGERIVVGLNSFHLEPEKDNLLPLDTTQIKPSKEQVKKLEEWKASRDKVALDEKLRILHGVASDKKKNLMPYIIEATAAGATTGETLGVIRLAYGEPYDILDRITLPFRLD